MNGGRPKIKQQATTRRLPLLHNVAASESVQYSDALDGSPNAADATNKNTKITAPTQHPRTSRR